MTEQEKYDCNDENLGAMLHRLFSEGHDEVEVLHPTEGTVVVTRKDFEKHLANIHRVNNMSPAERIEQTKRLKALKKQKQIRFRTALIDAPVHKVDMDDGKFGVDVEGVTLDIDGKIFVAVKDYPKGTEIKPNEVGCFMGSKEESEIIRITQ